MVAAPQQPALERHISRVPAQLVQVLTQREIANQEVETYKMQRSAQDQRTETEKAKGTADMQADLAKSQVGVEIQNNRTAARKMEAQGEAAYIEQTGSAQGAQVRSVGLARAEAYQRQVAALGPNATALVNAVGQSLNAKGKATGRTVKAVTRLVAELAKGVRGAEQSN